jgi:hypothetical protein
LKIKLKGRHFDTIEVIETESQAVLNTLTEHVFQDALKNGRSAGNGAYARKGTISRVMVASRLKVSFYHRAASVPKIIDVSLYMRTIPKITSDELLAKQAIGGGGGEITMKIRTY